MPADPGTPLPTRISPPAGYDYDASGNLVQIPLDPWAAKESASPGSYTGLTINDIDFTRAFEDLSTEIKRNPSVFLSSDVTGRQTILDEGMAISTDLSAVNKTEQTMRSVATLISGMSMLSSANKLSYGEENGSGSSMGTYAGAGGSGYISPDGKTFPVAGKVNLVDGWHDKRVGHLHQGNDIMAPRGAPVLAMADGTIFKTNPTWHPGDSGLGGISVWLRDTNGTTYYYAHLDSIAGGIGPGVNVRVGQTIGYVGNTGNAYPGATHVHFEIHPNGGGAIDPYPILSSLYGQGTA